MFLTGSGLWLQEGSDIVGCTVLTGFVISPCFSVPHCQKYHVDVMQLKAWNIIGNVCIDSHIIYLFNKCNQFSRPALDRYAFKSIEMFGKTDQWVYCMLLYYSADIIIIILILNELLGMKVIVFACVRTHIFSHSSNPYFFILFSLFFRAEGKWEQMLIGY